MNPEIVSILKCPNCKSENLSSEIFDRNKNRQIENGRILCRGCSEWFRIDNYILDFLPPSLRNTEKYGAFAKRHGLDMPGTEIPDSTSDNYKMQRAQINFFRENSKVYDQDITNLKFYQVSDRLTMHRWIKKLPSDIFVLDIAGGTGRQAIPLAESGHNVVSFDISEEMLLKAVEKAGKADVLDRISFMIADAYDFPFSENTFDAAICYGNLHHVPDPALTIKNSGKVLRKGGYWFSYDPNKSPVRFIFDWAMKFKKLYDEEASVDELLNVRVLSVWLKEAGIKADIRYHTFLLPQMVNILPDTLTSFALRLTDGLFGKIPLLKSFGGVIISVGKKQVGNDSKLNMQNL